MANRHDESWEFQNNTSDRMLFKSSNFSDMYTDPETLEVYPAWKNDFEARFPDDTWEDTTQLKTFLDWMVSTDRDQATGKALDSPHTYNEVEYTKDTAEYRLAKFKAEIEDYAEIDSLVFYYVFTEFFLMVDSRAKNLFIGFHGSECPVEGIRRKIVAEPYDMDTALGTNNEGTLTYGYSLEDTDKVDGADVFNGQNSVLWCNLRDTKRQEIVRMYQALRSSGGLSYSAVDARFAEAQSKWPEVLWNEDAQSKYIEPLVNPEAGKEPTDFYLPMCQGAKDQQRKWWLTNRFAYMDSKWNAGDALASVIQLRGYAKADICVTPYIDLYPTVKYGSYLAQKRGKAGVPATLVCPMDNVNDTEIYIYSAPHIASVGDLSDLKVGVADFSQAINIQEVKLGDADASYANPNMKSLSFGSNVLLKKIDVRNCTMLGTGEQKSVDVSNCVILEEAYFDGTAIQAISLPNGGILKKLHVPGTMTNLTIRNQKNIEEFVIPSYSNISTLWLENNSAVIDSKAMLYAIPENARVRLIGFAWEAADAAEIAALLDLLDTMRGLDEYGNNTDDAQVSGTIHTEALTGAQIAEYNSRYPYVTVTADHTTSYRTYANQDGTVIKTVTCIDGVPQEAAPTGLTKANSADGHYSYTFVGWSKSMNATTADADALDNVLADRTVYAAFSETVRTYTVTWKNTDGTVLRTDSNVAWGTTPSWGQAMPTYNGETAQGWTPSPGAITGNTIYTATYIPIYTVYFYNGSTLLEQQTVQQGGSATYSGSTPVKTGVENPEEYTFTGWSPSPTNIQANTSCYAQFEEPQVWFDEEITDSWDTILANIASGTFSYKPGNYKPLDLGTEGIVNMQIVGLNKDVLASGGGNAKTSWISKELLATSHRMNPSRSGSSGAYDTGTGAIGGWGDSEMRTYMKNTIKPLIPSAVRSAIKDVTKYSRIYDTTGTAQSNIATTDDVWIPSRQEMFGNYSSESSGVHYSDGFNANADRVKSKVGASSASWWWLRSAGDYYYFSYVFTDGSRSIYRAYYSGAVVLGFCI